MYIFSLVPCIGVCLAINIYTNTKRKRKKQVIKNSFLQGSITWIILVLASLGFQSTNFELKPYQESKKFTPIFSEMNDSVSVVLFPILNLKGGKSNFHQVVNDQLSEINDKYDSKVRIRYCDSLEIFNFSKKQLKVFLKKNNANIVAWGEFLEKDNDDNDIYSLDYFSSTYQDYSYLNLISNTKGNYVEISPNELL